MTIWAKIAIFETTAKNSVLGRWGVTPHLQYEKKLKNPFFCNLQIKQI